MPCRRGATKIILAGTTAKEEKVTIVFPIPLSGQRWVRRGGGTTRYSVLNAWTVHQTNIANPVCTKKKRLGL